MTSSNASETVIHVAAAAIYGSDGRLLVSKRAVDAHQGGLWEFPGGKVEPGETVRQALSRELEEELGIQVQTAQPLIRIPHHYADKTVLLDVWRVLDFVGEPEGREGQPLKWLATAELDPSQFPAANRSIINALQLPDHYLITGDFADTSEFIQRLEQALQQGVKLVQLRAKQLDQQVLQGLVVPALRLCRPQGARLILNASFAQAQSLQSSVLQSLGLALDGVHLSSAHMHTLDARTVEAMREGLGLRCIGASCHSPEQLAQAASLGVDYVSLSPIQITATHPDAEPLGWHTFANWVDAAAVPVYALGGMSVKDIERSKESGGQGVAMIRGLWESGAQ